MMNQKFNLCFAAILVVFAILMRLLPLPHNFACFGALALFSGCYLRGNLAWLVPLGALAITDLIGHFAQIPGAGLYGPIGMGFVYGAYLASFGIGRLVRIRINILTVVLGAVGSSMSFYLISNFGSFLTMPEFYSRDISGLIQCYIAALPFYRGTFNGDLVFSALFFSTHFLAYDFLPQPEVRREHR
jgi:hypothetical protein